MVGLLPTVAAVADDDVADDAVAAVLCVLASFLKKLTTLKGVFPEIFNFNCYMIRTHLRLL